MSTVAAFVVMMWWWHEVAPPAWPAGLGVRVVVLFFRLSRWSSFCGHFGDCGSGGRFVDDGFLAGVGGDEGLDGEVVHRSGQASGDLVDECDGIVAEQGVRPASQ